MSADGIGDALTGYGFTLSSFIGSFEFIGQFMRPNSFCRARLASSDRSGQLWFPDCGQIVETEDCVVQRLIQRLQHPL